MTQDYLLNRDSYETNRLNKGHFLWSRALGYVISPRVLKTLPRSGAQIADFGTGTGVWLLEVAKKMQKTGVDWQYTGFDLSDQQFPPQGELPPNVKLTLGDIKKPFPKELHGKFDLIHLRLLLLGLEPNEWEIVAKNLTPLLKPGGWIEWSEIDPYPMSNILRSNVEECQTENLKRGFDYLIDSIRSRVFDAHEHLDKAFKSAGLTNVHTDAVSSDRYPEMRADMTGLITGVMIGVGKQRIADGTKGAWSLEKLEETREAMEEEVKQGAYISFNIVSISARKPN